MTVEARPPIPRLRDGDYELQEALATGGMATVYTAHARSLNTTVAIKVLAPRFARDPELMGRFHAEAESIANLHHPNILEVYYCGEDSGVAYIAMRFVPGGTLKDLAEALGGPMDLRTAARITGQVAAALQHAHDHGMIHLDVKPGNVLLGNADWPLLSDFGIIRIAGDTREDNHRVAGTPAYMSPEQWQGGSIDGRSDQYSLGLMFYELVTGQRPFAGQTSAELMAKHLTEEPLRPRLINPGIPGPVEEVVLRALAKQPDDRFPTIAEFGAALTEAVERSQGMQLETKQAIVSAAPNLVALAGLSLFAPLLESLPNPNEPIFRSLTLDWPVALLVAILQIGLLLGMRWQIIGLATKLMGSIIDSLDRLTRQHVRLGTEAGGPLQVSKWRNAALSTAEGLINVAYLFVVYQLAAVPLTRTLALPIDPGLEDVIATAITGLVLLFSGAIVLRVYRATGPIVGVCALAVCWAFISSLPLVDRQVLGTLSLQWLIKLAVGLAVLAAFLAVRPRVQRAVRNALVPFAERQLRGLQRGRAQGQIDRQRHQVESGLDGLVDALYLVVGYALIALPVHGVLVGVASTTVTAAVVTVAILLIAAYLVNLIRVSSGIVAATLGLVICSPTLLGLPLFVPDSSGASSMQWAARAILGLAVLALFLGVRGRIQTACRPMIVPVVARQLAALRPSTSEDEEAERRKSLGHSADAVVDVGYLVVGYLAVVSPVTAAFAATSDLRSVSTVVYLLFVGIVAYTLYRLVRDFVPKSYRVSLATQPRPASPS